MKNFLLVILLIVTVAMSATTIYDIQYTTNAGSDGTYPSPLVDTEVTVQGIVTAIGADEYQGNTKFFISEQNAGAWKGIYVYNWNVDVQLGDMVEVTGDVTEHYGLTELSYCDVTILSSGNPVPNPIIVTTGQMSSGMTAESYEGCLVKVMNVTVTTEPDQYAQFAADDNTGACFIDDLFDVYPEPVVGTTYTSIIGMGHYTFGEYTINPRTMDDVQAGTPVSNNKKSWGKIKSIYK